MVLSATLQFILWGIPWPKKLGATYYHAHLGFLDNNRAIKGLVICHSWDVSTLGSTIKV